MSAKWLIYWILVADDIVSFAVIMIFIAILFIIIYLTFIRFEINKEEKVIGDKWLKRSVISLLVSIIIIIFIPSKKDFMSIYFGGETIEYIKEDKHIQNVPSKTFEYIEKYLDEKIKILDNNGNKN